MESDLYQHIKDARSHDAQTLDTATDDQLQQQALPNKDEEESEAPQQDDDVEMQEDDDDDQVLYSNLFYGHFVIFLLMTHL